MKRILVKKPLPPAKVTDLKPELERVEKVAQALTETQMKRPR